LRPIQGAWLTWRVPTDEALELVFSDPAFTSLPGREGFGMLSGADGRFSVERLADDLPPEARLFAVARGYAVAVVEPGLRDELVIDLEREGGLRLTVSGRLVEGVGEPRLTWLKDPSGLYQRGYLARLRPEGRGEGSFLFRRLRAGTYRVTLGEEGVTTVVEVGRVSEAALPAPAALEVSGLLLGHTGPEPTWLVLERADGSWGREVSLGEDGSFEAEVPAGDYVLRLVEPHRGSERHLGRVEQSVQLELRRPSGSRYELVLRPSSESNLGPVGVAGVGPEGDMLSAEWVEAGRYQVEGAQQGPHHVFVEGAYLGTVELGPGAIPELRLEPWEVEIAFELPELREEERLRAEVSLVPTVLADEARVVRRVFFPEGELPPPPLLLDTQARASFTLYRPGRYRVVVSTDLGRAEAELQIGQGQRGPFMVDLR
jgi:hypothetical protein